MSSRTLERRLLENGTTYLAPHAEIMAAHLAAAGVRCELEVWDGQPHVFKASLDVAPEAREAIARIGRFVRGVHGRF